MKGTENVTGKVPPPAWRKLLVLGGLLMAAAVLAHTARAQAPQEQVQVADVVVHGCRTISPEEVKNRLRTHAGREYNPVTVQDDLNRLAETKWFRTFRVHPQSTPDGRVIVHFIVEEHPSVVREVVYKNANHVKPEELDQITGVKKGAPLNPSQNLRACFEIQDYYRKKGRLFASVYLEEGKNPGDTRVVFNITEGAAVKIRKISFTGNDHLATTARLRTQIDSRQMLLGLGFMGEYNPPMVEHDAFKLEEYYKGNGYLDVCVTREVTVNDDLRSVDVTFHIHEGLRYRVQDVTLEGPKALSRDLVTSILRVKKDDIYSEPAIDGDLKNITDLYGFRGYGIVTDKKLFFADKDKEPGVVRIQYEVFERGQAQVGTINITGNTVTKDRVIRRVLQLYPGQTLSYPLLRQGERDLARLGIFETNQEKGTKPTLIVRESDDPDNPVRDIDVIVTEQPTGSLMFGLGVNSDAGLVGSVVLNEKNFDILRPPTSLDDIFNGRAFRGAGQEFRAEAVPGTQLQRYTVSFREPFLFDQPISFSTSGYYYDRIYNEYNERREGGRVTLGKQLNRYWSVTAGLRLENVEVSGVSIFAPPDITNVQGNHLLVGPRVGVIRDDRDSFIRPTDGSLLDLSAEYLTGDYSFPILSAEATKYFTTYQRADGSGRHVLVARSQVAYAGSNTPVYERFYAGGFRSLRGFQFRGVGPNVNGFEVGGDFLFLNSLEYQVPIKANDQLYVVAFLDTGTVERDVSLHDYRVSAGVGLRITLPMLGPVPIALDLGFPIVSGPGDRQQVFNFYIGAFR